MIFTASVPMADVIHENHHLLPIINRFGITLGFGSKTIQEVCHRYGINCDFFIEVLNAYNTKEFFPEDNLRSYPIKVIVEYLQNTHDYFLNVKIPQIGQQIDELLKNTIEANKDKVLLVKQFFAEYRSELEAHTLQEDNDIYPYTLQVEHELSKDVPDSKFVERVKNDPISNYAQEHGNVDEKLYDLKNIIIKYLPPLSDCNQQNLVLYALFNLEQDMKSHTSFEERVLVPKVVELEKALLEKTKTS